MANCHFVFIAYMQKRKKEKQTHKWIIIEIRGSSTNIASFYKISYILKEIFLLIEWCFINTIIKNQTIEFYISICKVIFCFHMEMDKFCMQLQNFPILDYFLNKCYNNLQTASAH